MKDIASRANVSVSTVSKIINKETKNFRKETVDRVQKIIKEMGYAPNIVARSMVTKKTGLIGLILPDISNLYFAEMAKFSMSLLATRFRERRNSFVNQ